jgi:hypothetical protein
MRSMKIAGTAWALAWAALAMSAQGFTIAVLPDAQNYSNYRYQTTATPPFFMDQADIFYRQTAYVAAHAASAGGTIAFAIQLGDLVQSQGKKESEWLAADKAISALDGALPFGIVPGNHDYDLRRTSPTGKGKIVDGGKTFCSYFGPDSKHFKGKSWYGGSFDGGMDSWSTFEAGGKTFLFLGLELEPSSASLDWAQGVLDAHSGMPTILATHEYLSCFDEPREPGQAMRLKDAYRAGMDRTTPQELWDKLIAANAQIFLVLCGHHYNGRSQGEGSRVDLDRAGFPVYQLLSDYQGRAEIQARAGVHELLGHCGDGWMRLMDFDLSKGEIRVRTYSTELDRYEKDADSDFRIKLDWDWDARFPQNAR